MKLFSDSRCFKCSCLRKRNPYFSKLSKKIAGKCKNRKYHDHFSAELTDLLSNLMPNHRNKKSRQNPKLQENEIAPSESISTNRLFVKSVFPFPFIFYCSSKREECSKRNNNS